jgi:hypothetical protein
MTNTYSKNNHCKCGKLITDYAIHCKSCAMKKLRKDPQNHPLFGKTGKLAANWQGGKTLKKTFCSCGKELCQGAHYSKVTKCHSCAIKGKNHPNWKDGSSLEDYPSEFNTELKEQIRKRDNYKCQNCEMIEEENIIVYGRILDVHHIDYNKENCSQENLITLCQGCNLRANYNRDYWKELYTNKITKGVTNG